MKARPLAVVACRALAAYALVWALIGLPWAMANIRDTVTYGRGALRHTLWTWGLVLSSYAGLVIFGVLLWRHAGSVGRWMLKGIEGTEPSEDDGQPLTGVDLDVHRIVFTAIGAYFAVIAVPGLVCAFVWFGEGGITLHLNPRALVKPCLRLLAALALLFGARGIARLMAAGVRWLRTVGRRPQDLERRAR